MLSWQTRVLEVEKRKAQLAEARPEARAELLVKVFAEADPLGTGPHATLLDALAAVGFDIGRSLAAGDEAGSALAATAAEAYWRLGERGRAAILAEAALCAAAPMPPQELAMLLAIVMLAEPTPSPAEWSAFAGRQAALRLSAAGRAELGECDLAKAFDEALELLGSPPEQRSLVAELKLECAAQGRAPEEARAELRRIETWRASLAADHPARLDLVRLQQRVDQLGTGANLP